nr:AAA family ATPase [uncultured Eisenbergiella sp.]
MYCILVTGIPASGKSTMAGFLADTFGLPVISKDRIKELMYDTIGFRSREEKVRLGTAAMEIMYDTAEQLMKRRQPFVLENNFENASKVGLDAILDKYAYKAITVILTGDTKIIYQRFLERNNSPDRHPGHVVNDCYPGSREAGCPVRLSYESFAAGIVQRGMDTFTANGPQIIVDTTDYSRVDREALVRRIREEMV